MRSLELRRTFKGGIGFVDECRSHGFGGVYPHSKNESSVLPRHILELIRARVVDEYVTDVVISVPRDAYTWIESIAINLDDLSLGVWVPLIIMIYPYPTLGWKTWLANHFSVCAHLPWTIIHVS